VKIGLFLATEYFPMPNQFRYYLDIKRFLI
jgi:hypothetical protein